MVTAEEDGRTVVLREIVVGHRGRSGRREIWRRTFKSAAAGRRAQVCLGDHAKDLPALMAKNRFNGERAIDAAIDARNAKFQQVSTS